jgi:mRNA interferase RelE/StbE
VSNYSVELKPSARKELDPTFTRIDLKITGLETDPRPAGCKKLIGHADLLRIRIGDWRVIYIIDELIKLVNVTRVARRKDVYEDL